MQGTRSPSWSCGDCDKSSPELNASHTQAYKLVCHGTTLLMLVPAGPKTASGKRIKCNCYTASEAILGQTDAALSGWSALRALYQAILDS